MPAGASGTSLTFENVINAGETTVTITASAPTLPPGHSPSLVLFFDIETTATFSGSVEICLPYDPAIFTNPAAITLLHFVSPAWQVVPSTTSTAGVICGSVTSFSPFAITQLEPEVAPMEFVGFSSPVDMNGAINVVKGGSTVPLKFEVYQGGVELTDVSVIASFTVSRTTCDTGVVEDEIEFTTTGNTSLKYSGGQFHQNWKTPKVKGCYKVVVTTIDGATLEAYFKLK